METIHRIDPPGCGCTDCITGWSKLAADESEYECANAMRRIAADNRELAMRYLMDRLDWLRVHAGMAEVVPATPDPDETVMRRLRRTDADLPIIPPTHRLVLCTRGCTERPHFHEIRDVSR